MYDILYCVCLSSTGQVKQKFYLTLKSITDLYQNFTTRKCVNILKNNNNNINIALKD